MDRLMVPSTGWFNGRHGSLDRGLDRHKDDPVQGRRSLSNLSHPSAGRRASAGVAEARKISPRPSGVGDQLLTARRLSPTLPRRTAPAAAEASTSEDSSPLPGRRKSSGILGRLLHALENEPAEEQYTPEQLKQRVFRDWEEAKYDEEEELVLAGGGVVSDRTRESSDFLLLVDVLEDWLNEVLSARRIIVRSIFRDLSDGQVLTELMEILTGETAPGIRGLQATTAGKMQRLEETLKWIDKELPREPRNGGTDLWTAMLVAERDVLATLHLLVALAKRYDCPHQLPPGVSVEVIRAVDGSTQSENKENLSTSCNVSITGGPRIFEEVDTGSTLQLSSTGDLLAALKEDVFDKFFRQVPHKVKAAKDVLLKFSNDRLERLGLHKPNSDFDEAFTDGVTLVYLLAVLGEYFVPLYSFRSNPADDSEKIMNVETAFQLMRDAGLKPKGKPVDIVEGDAKATMRILYAIFHKYK